MNINIKDLTSSILGIANVVLSAIAFTKGSLIIGSLCLIVGVISLIMSIDVEE